MSAHFKQLSPTEWDAERDGFDFHIRLEADDYVIDVFDAGIDDPAEAHITSHSCETWEQVVAFCERYDGVMVF